MRSKLAIFSAVISMTSAASAAPSLETLFRSGSPVETPSAFEPPYCANSLRSKLAVTGSPAERGVILSRLAANDLKTLGHSLPPGAGSEVYAAAVLKTSSDIEDSVAELELALKAKDSMALRMEASRMMPMIENLRRLSAAAQWTCGAPKEIKRLADNFDIQLLAIRANARSL